MESWECGPRMVLQSELEEGEACYYKDDANMDPDVVLSYIGDKVQSLLGHLQKDFEGGASAENLGAKFGGYGSFLPMHQRFPSARTQPKSPHGLQNLSIPKSPNKPAPEGPAPISTMVSDKQFTRTNGSSSPPSLYSSKDMKSSKDSSIRENELFSTNIVAEPFPGKTESKLDNPTEQRTLKVRLKLGSDRISQYKAEIHCLGLTSPSSSPGNSPEESARLTLESGESLDESPARILQIMTSFLVSAGSLLSPLSEDYLNFGREAESLVESEHETAPKSSGISIKIRNRSVPSGGETKSADKNKDLGRSKNINNFKQKNSGSKTMAHKLQPLDANSKPAFDVVSSASEFLNDAALPDSVRNPEKDVPLKKRKGGKDRSKGSSIPTEICGKYDQLESRISEGWKVGEHATSSFQRNNAVNVGLDNNNRVSQNCASVKSSNMSDGEKGNVSLDKSVLKVGVKDNSREHNNLDSTIDIHNLSCNKKSKLSQSSNKIASNLSNNLKDVGLTVLKDNSSGKKGTPQVNFSRKDVMETSGEHTNNLKASSQKASSDSSKNSNLRIAKAKHMPSDKLDRSSNQSYTKKMTSETYVTEPPAESLPINEEILAGTEQTMVNPVLIQEDWVLCDRCEKWRLLPYGKTSEQLPEKWVCSMLDWLPGMNSCNIHQDDTTNAVRALLAHPAPEIHKPFSGLSSVEACQFIPDNSNFASDPITCKVKSKKINQRSNTFSKIDPAPSHGTSKNLQCSSVKTGNLKEMNQPLEGVKATNKFNLQHPNKSKVSVSKLNKRKEEHLIGDDASVRKKIKMEPFQDVQGKVKKIKPKGVHNLDSSNISVENLDRIDLNLNSGLHVKETVIDRKKASVQKDKINLGRGTFQSSVKNQKGQLQDLPDNGSLNLKVGNSLEVSEKKRKYLDCMGREHLAETLPNSLSNYEEKEVSLKKKCKTETLQEIKDGDMSRNRKVSENRALLSRKNENSTKRSMEKKWQLKNVNVKQPLTKEDIDKLRKDLGCEQFSTAATSSSSKISDSRRNRVGFLKVNGSPEESVSSSPMKTSYVEQVLPLAMETAGKDGYRINDFSTVCSAKKSLDTNERAEWGVTRKGKGSNIHHHDPIENTALELRERIATEIPFRHHVSRGNLSSDFEGSFLADNEDGVLEHGFSSIPVNCGHRKEGMSKHHSSSMLPQQNPGRNSARTSTLKKRINCADFDRVTEKVSNLSTGSEIFDLKEKMKEEIDANDDYGVPQSEVLSTVKHPFSDDPSMKSGHNNKKSGALEENIVNENVSDHTALTALKEARDFLKRAEELKTHAYLIKSSGFGSESNYEYFESALMFLQGASIFEAYNVEHSQNLEIKPTQSYGTAAKLCEMCADEYEKSCELAAAALAYKCVEVAYLRIVYCKSGSANRQWRDLLTSLQMAPQGESPSSSASDIDNLNNLVLGDRTTFSKANDSHAVNHIMFSRNRANFIRLLDFTKDVNSAMEAAKKAQDAFAAARVKLEESQNKTAIVAVKRVIDLSFHDVEELINSVRLAFDAVQARIPSSARQQ